jgi:hypothetical protein
MLGTITHRQPRRLPCSRIRLRKRASADPQWVHSDIVQSGSQDVAGPGSCFPEKQKSDTDQPSVQLLLKLRCLRVTSGMPTRQEADAPLGSSRNSSVTRGATFAPWARIRRRSSGVTSSAGLLLEYEAAAGSAFGNHTHPHGHPAPGL